MPTITSKAYTIAGALLKEANAIKQRVDSLLPQAIINYSEAKETTKNWDFAISNSLNPSSCFDEINELTKQESFYRERGTLLKDWLNKLDWTTKQSQSGKSYKVAEVSFKQFNFIKEQELDYSKLIKKYYN
jgi:hypothetical protein